MRHEAERHRRPAARGARRIAGRMGAVALLLWSGHARAQEPEPPPDDASVPRGGAGAVVVPERDAPPAPGKVTLPRLKKYAAPVYPAEAARSGVEGTVTLKLDIDAAGRVSKAVVGTAGGHGFDEAALAAAPGLLFEPARRADGTPFPARILYQYKFVLTPRAADTKAEAGQPDKAPPAVETIAGRVLAAGADAPLAGVTVVLHRADRTTETAVTDAAGAFRFKGLPAGKYRIAIAAAGFDPFEASEDIAANEAIEVKYRLSVTVKGDDVVDVTVRGDRRPREVTRRTLEKREIERIPGTMGDALRALQNLPGVARTGFGGLLIVRGSAPQDSLTFIDRAPVPIVYHFGGLASVVPTEMLEKIDFFPGNFGAEYGRAMGGIVDVTLRSPKQDRKLHGVVQLDLIDGRLLLEGPIPYLKGWTFLAAGRRSWIDAILGPALSSAGAGITQAPAYYDYQFVIEGRPSTRERFRASFYGSDDAFKLLIDEIPENEPLLTGNFGLHTAFQRAQLSYENRWSDSDRISWTTALGRDAQDFQAGPFYFQNEVLSLNVRLEASRRLARWATAHFGADVSLGLAKVTVHAPDPPDTGQPPIGPFSTLPALSRTYDGVFSRPAVYAELELTPLPRLRIVPGVRLDFAVDTGEVDVSPRVNGRYDLAAGFPRTTVKGGVGLYHQPPQFQESVPPFGTRGLSSNRAVHYGLGVEQEITRRLEVSVEGFTKQLDRLVVSQPGGGYANTGAGYAAGGELLLKYKPDDLFFGWLSYTLSRSVRTDRPGAEERLASFDQTHIFTVLGSFKLPRGFEVGARFRLGSGNLQTPYICNPGEPACDPGRVNAVFHASANSFEPIPYGNAYRERLPLFHQLDIRADKVWRFKHWRFSMYLDVQNVYNNQNVEGYSYNANYTQRGNVTGLPILPTIGFRGDF